MRRSKLLKYSSVLTAVIAGAGSAALAPTTAIAAGESMTIKATDDTYVSSGRPAEVLGNEDKLVAGVLGKDVKTSFVKFTVPAGAAVSGAQLTMALIGKQTGTVTLRQVAATSWTEATLTAATAPVQGAPLASAAIDGTSLVIDLKAVVKAPGTYAFALSSTGAPMRFSSTEAVTGAPELKLMLTAFQPATPTKPTTTPATTPATKPAGDCVTGALLVPSCGVLWGAAAGGFTDAPRDQALKDWEKLSGRTSALFHTYHKGDEIFPTKAEIVMTQDPTQQRVLLTNWKVAYGSTWAKVAQGQQDKRIDAFAVRAKAYGKQFFLVLNHEPENDVVAKAGSGMEAKDFAAMYRHTILRLRAQGVTNVINVMAYMGNEKWMAQSWWKDLYPGDDVVDWMGLDSYVSVEKGYYHFGGFADLLDRKATGGGVGFYDWATTQHRSKPMMVAEWGAYHRIGRTTDKSAMYNGVLAELAKRPAIKAIVYFDTKADDQGDRDISIDSSAASLASFRKMAADKIFNVRIG